jgi:hypothetical protein
MISIRHSLAALMKALQSRLGSKKSLPGAPLFSEVEDLPHDTLRAFYLDASCSPKGVIDEVEPGCLGVAAGPRLQPLDTLDTRFVACSARQP